MIFHFVIILWPTVHVEQAKKIRKTRQQLFCFTQERPKVTQNGIALMLCQLCSILCVSGFALFCPCRVRMLATCKMHVPQNQEKQDNGVFFS